MQRKIIIDTGVYKDFKIIQSVIDFDFEGLREYRKKNH